MKSRTLFLLIPAVAAIAFLYPGVGHCGQADFYNDFGSPLVAPITSNGVIARYVHSDESQPVAVPSFLDRIIYNRNVEISTPRIGNTGDSHVAFPFYSIRAFRYDDYGRVVKTLITDPVSRKLRPEKVYSYEPGAPEWQALITRVIRYTSDDGNPLSTPLVDSYIYKGNNSGTKKLDKIKTAQLHGTELYVTEQPDYTPGVFPNSSGDPSTPLAHLNYVFSRNADHHVTLAAVTETMQAGDGDYKNEYKGKIILKYDQDGRLVRSIDSTSGTNKDILYISNAGLLREVKNKGGSTIAWYQYYTIIVPGD